QSGLELANLEDVRSQERLDAARLQSLLPLEEPVDQSEAADDQPRGRRDPEPLRRARLGNDPAPLGGAQDAEHDRPQPDRRQRDSDVVDARAPLCRSVDDALGEQEDRDDDNYLAGEYP